MPVYALYMIIFAVALVSSFAQTITGFGYAIVMMAILPVFLPGAVCTTISIIGGCGMGIWMLYLNIKYFKLKSIVFVSLFSSLGILAGLLFGAKISSDVYMRILGIFLVVLSAWMWKISKSVKIPANFCTGAAAGTLAGAIGALFAIAGPPLVLYYNASSESKEKYMASLQATLVVHGIVTLTARAAVGLWPPGVWQYLIPLTIGTVVGIIPGKAIYKKLDAAAFQQLIYLFMCLAGIFIAVTA